MKYKIKALITLLALVPIIARAEGNGDVINYAPHIQKPEDAEAERIQRAINEHKVRIGMTAAQCLQAWGKPDDINRTTNDAGKQEQWVYGSRGYLYLDNGVLTAIQN